jgi:hypothetical protein
MIVRRTFSRVTRLIACIPGQTQTGAWKRQILHISVTCHRSTDTKRPSFLWPVNSPDQNRGACHISQFCQKM